MKTILKIVSLVLALAVAGCASLATNVNNGISTFTTDVNKVASDVVTVGKTTVTIGGDVATVGTDVVKSAGAIVTATTPTPAPAATPTPTPAPTSEALPNVMFPYCATLNSAATPPPAATQYLNN
jgi:hypothetical protein